jgi:hypothetical protein
MCPNAACRNAVSDKLINVTEWNKQNP